MQRPRVSLAGREEAYVALDIGPTGKLLQPMGDLPFERAVELFSEKPFASVRRQAPTLF